MTAPWRVLVIGDPHFTDTNQVATDALEAAVVSLADLCEVILVLGDICDGHHLVRLNARTRAVHFLERCADLHPTVVLIGNHDLEHNNRFLTQVHPLVGLTHPYLTIVDYPTVLAWPFKTVAVPYVPPGRFQEALDLVDTKGMKLVIAHQEFKGGEIYPGQPSTIGDVPPPVKLVISGHLHTRQRVGNVFYPGTPYPITFADGGEKAVSILTFDRTGRYKSEERFTLDVPPKETKVIEWDDFLTGPPPAATGQTLRVLVEAPEERLSQIRDQKALKRWEDAGIQVRPVYPRIVQSEPPQTSIREEALKLLSAADRPKLEELWSI